MSAFYLKSGENMKKKSHYYRNMHSLSHDNWNFPDGLSA